MKKSAAAMMRDALQILLTHPTVINPVAAALAAAGPIPGWREGGYTAWQARNECLLLQALNAPDETRPELVSDDSRLARRANAHCVKKPVYVLEGKSWFHQRINARAALKAHIDKCARNGMIGIVESGRDCDCVEYTHPRSAIPATVAAFEILERDTGKWADGPFSLSITTPEEAEETPHESRDLALEAFEDGHPHSIVSRFP